MYNQPRASFAGPSQNIDFVGLGASKQDHSSWVPTLTKNGDTLSSLSRMYNVSAGDIVEANGVPFSNDAINEWVVSRGGKCLDRIPGQPPVKGCDAGGWAVFSNNTEILLPNINRPAKAPTTSKPSLPGPHVPKKMPGTGTNWLLWGGLAAAGTAVLVGLSVKASKGKTVEIK